MNKNSVSILRKSKLKFSTDIFRPAWRALVPQQHKRRPPRIFRFLSWVYLRPYSRGALQLLRKDGLSTTNRPMCWVCRCRLHQLCHFCPCTSGRTNRNRVPGRNQNKEWGYYWITIVNYLKKSLRNYQWFLVLILWLPIKFLFILFSHTLKFAMIWPAKASWNSNTSISFKESPALSKTFGIA